jgi:hypothetical protein
LHTVIPVIAQSQTEIPRKDQENKPKKKRERFSPDLASLSCSEERKAKLAEWLEYKNQKRQHYVQAGWSKLMSKLDKFTDHQVSTAIDKAIEKGWSGMFPENEPATATATQNRGQYQPAQAPTFTVNATAPPEAYEEVDFFELKRASRAKADEELNGVRYVDK